MLFSKYRAFLAIILIAILVGCGGGGGGGGTTSVHGTTTSTSDTTVTTNQSVSTSTSTDGTDGQSVADPPPPTTIKATYRAYAASADDDPTYYDEQGGPISQKSFTDGVMALPENPDHAISVQVLDTKPGTDKIAQDVRIGCIWMDIRRESHYVGGCIKRNGWHLNFHIRYACNPQRDLFNLHVMAWFENGPQVGLYESESRWCAQSRGKYTEIKNTFIKAFAVVGITGLTAVILADVAAGATVAAFAL